MELAPWLVGGNRNLRRRFPRNKSEDNIKLDLSKDPCENVKEILKSMCSSDLVDIKIVNHANNFVKLIQHLNSNLSVCRFSLKEILYCLRFCLSNDSTTVRAATYRAIRHLIQREEDIVLLNKLLLPFMMIRSLDLAYKNDAERVEAIKLIRKMLLISPYNFNIVLARYLVSLCNGGIEEKDRMLRVSMAALSELGILNPDLFIASGGVAAITRNLLECQTPNISESLCGVLLLLLDRPITRNHAAIDLHCVAAPYCDFHYRHGWMDKNRDERELRFNCSRLALLSILRSWPGILHFCSPNDKSGLKAIVDVLYLNQLEVRKAVLDLLYELLNLPQPEWTDELSVALSAIDPVEPQASWRLGEGFVAAEGRSILPHLARTTPNISDMHLALLLYCFLETGLLTALSEVIATSDTFISVRATVLLGELLRLIQVLLPPKCCNVTPPLPNLIHYAINRPQALQAITALQQLHKLLKKRPASYSLYLDFILRNGTTFKSSHAPEKVRRTKSSSRSRLSQLVSKDGDDAIKESGVLSKRDATTWNWSVVQIILKKESDFTIDVSETNHRSFLKRLVEYFMPSSKGYSHMDLITSPKNSQGYSYTIAGIDLIDFLVHMNDTICYKLLCDLFSDIALHIRNITKGKSAHDCLFSPQHMANTQCQTYFLFLGRLNSCQRGKEIFKEMDFHNLLYDLAVSTNHDCYVKLIVSSLDYNNNSKSIDILSGVLKCNNEASRLYATQILLVLLRAGLPKFSEWGIKLLSQQLSDPSRTVYLSALSTLHEACEIKANLEQLVNINPEMLHLGEKGLLLLIRFLSIPAGFAKLNKNEFVLKELKRWDEYYNHRYVFLIEGETSDALTLHQRGEDGRYDKRHSMLRSTSKKDLFLPPHIYGQLAKHEEGLKLIMKNDSVDSFVQVIENAISMCESETDITNIKSALWVLGHLGSSIGGFEYVQKKGVLPLIVNLAENCVVYSIRGTAFYTLGLMATTELGADHLTKLGWVCTRHDRHNRWPIIFEESEDLQMSEQSEEFDLQLMGDFNVPDQDSSTATDDGLDKYSINRKSVTLPHQSNSTGHHIRSLSESKTFEMAKAARKSEFVVGRHRDNSVTESTTSGVSSCESALGRSTINENAPTLTPIPSISSIHTLTGVRKRRNSESSRRLMSERSTISPASSSSSKFSMQDHIGYQTIRQIKMQTKFEDENTAADFSLQPPFVRIQSLDRYKVTRPTLSGHPLMNSLMQGLSLTSLSSVQKIQMPENRKTEQLYMGVTLPVNLSNLFPENQVIARRLSYTADRNILLDFDSDSSSECSTSTQMSGLKKTRSRHSLKNCLNCSNMPKSEKFDVQSDPKDTESESAQENEDEVRVKILLYVETLANPIQLKLTKQALLNLKQKHPKEFQDLCLYSDVCRLLSENSYRLEARRFLQDLFFDVNFEVLSKEIPVLMDQDRNSLPLNAKESKENQLSPLRAEKLSLERKEELKIILRSNRTRNDEDAADTVHLMTRFEAGSPILDSVREENAIASNENVCNNDGQKFNSITTEKTDSKPRISNILTLDQLKFTYNENKFPITRDEKRVVK